MPKPTTSRTAARALLTILVALSTACADDDGVTGVFSPGTSGLIVLTTVRAAGGRLDHETITVDSATARFEVVNCTTSGAVSACVDQQRTQGDVSPALIGQLFAITQTPDFMNLREAYDRDGDVVPPDGSTSQLVVTVAERTRTVRWASGAELPQILVRFQCWLDAARGSLIACA
jgi:hypothetical protein